MLTPKLKATLEYIQNYIAQKEYAPTLAEIAKGIGIRSRGVVHRYLQRLCDAQLIDIVPGKRRNILLKQPLLMQVPVLGRIAAGCPIEAIHNQETLDIAYTLLGKDRYALKVEGESMIDEGIMDGDLVICQHSESAQDGDIVVALIDSEHVTLKRFYLNRQTGVVTLRPANSKMKDLTYPASRVKIQGIMVGLLRLAQYPSALQ